MYSQVNGWEGSVGLKERLRSGVSLGTIMEESHQGQYMTNFPSLDPQTVSSDFCTCVCIRV